MEEKVVAPKAEKPVAKKLVVEPAESKLVTVENLTHSFLRQPSTGITIQGKAKAELKNDGWLQNQIAANLLKAV